MASTTGTFTQYTGPLTSDLSTASPGLSFLAAYISATDALDRASPRAAKLLDLVSPEVIFTTKCGDKDEPASLAKIQEMFAFRSTVVSKFSHTDEGVVVFELVNEQGIITLFCETVSVSVFKDDPKQEEIRASELLILKLEAAPDGKGIRGWWATEVKAYLDTSAIQAKAISLMGKKD